MSDRGVQQDPIDAKLHRLGNVTCCADSRIDDYGIVRVIRLQILHANTNIIGIQNPLSRSDGTARRHHRSGSCVLQLTCDNRIVRGVAEHLKTFVDKLLRRLECRDRIGQQGFAIAQHLKLDPIGS